MKTDACSTVLTHAVQTEIQSTGTCVSYTAHATDFASAQARIEALIASSAAVVSRYTTACRRRLSRPSCSPIDIAHA